MFRLLLIALALLCLPVVSAAQDCGDPPPVADQELAGEIEGKAQFLSRFLGEAELGGQIQTARKEIFSRYSNPDERSNAYFEYQVCIILQQDDSLTPLEKIEELKKIRREFGEPVIGIRPFPVEEARKDYAALCARAETYSPVPMCGRWVRTTKGQIRELEKDLGDRCFPERPFLITGFDMYALGFAEPDHQQYLGFYTNDRGAEFAVAVSHSLSHFRGADHPEYHEVRLTMPPLIGPTPPPPHLFAAAGTDKIIHYIGYYDAARERIVIQEKVVLDLRGQTVIDVKPDAAFSQTPIG